MWPQYILDKFARLSAEDSYAEEYYGVYNSILIRECFDNPQFSVEPQYPLSGAQTPGVDAIDAFVTYVVTVHNMPVLFLEISPCALDCCVSRAEFDQRMRDRFRELYDLHPTPRLHGISVMGHRVAFYCMDKATGVTPVYVEWSIDDGCTGDTVPEERWDTDITTEEGYQRLMTVVQDVKEMVHAL